MAEPFRPRESYPVFRSIPTRWMDNDVHGHVNSVVHYSLFDTAVNASVGRSSVRDAVGLFTAAAPHAAAEGFFVHVYVDRAGRRPVALPHDGRGALQRIAS